MGIRLINDSATFVWCGLIMVYPVIGYIMIYPKFAILMRIHWSWHPIHLLQDGMYPSQPEKIAMIRDVAEERMAS